MSTQFTPASPYSTIETDASQGSFTLRGLVEALAALKSVPVLAEIDTLMCGVDVKAEELNPFRGFKPGTYARHRVFYSEFAELLVLCWKPGQRTPIHDHNGSFGSVRVCEGVMWESMFSLDENRKLGYRTAREWLPGQVTGADVPDIHQIGNPEVSGQDLVTLHLYAPPLGVLNTYQLGSSEKGRYTLDEFMDGAGI